MKKQRVFSINETALRASVNRIVRGTGVDDRPIAISHPEIFKDSIVRPESKDSSESSTKEEL